MTAPRMVKPNALADFMGLPAFVDTELTSASFLLELAEGMVRDELDQHLYAVVDDEVELRCDGGSVLLLPELPVVSVTELAGADVHGSDWTTDGWYLDPGRAGRRGILRLAGGGFWPTKGTVSVTYSHGYQVGDEDPALEDWPYDLPAVVRAVIAQAAARGMSNPTQLRQEQEGRWGGTYAEVGLYLTATDKVALDPFRRGAG